MHFAKKRVLGIITSTVCLLATCTKEKYYTKIIIVGVNVKKIITTILQSTN